MTGAVRNTKKAPLQASIEEALQKKLGLA